MTQTNCLFTGVCVAGYSSSKNEILELSLPPKLCADENKVTNINTFQTLTFIIVNTISKCHLNPLARSLCVCGVQGLCAQRDFKVVNGGFTDGPVRCLKHVPGTR